MKAQDLDDLDPFAAGDGERASNQHFRVIRRLGAGGMGVVYEAEDRRSGARVALKTLRIADAASIYRFKNEFRSLADVTHPNLVALYDLFFDTHDLFFTMELVDGVDFLKYIAFNEHAETSHSAVFAETTLSDSQPHAQEQSGVVKIVSDQFEMPAPGPLSGALAPTQRQRCDYGRLRAALRQLSEGVIALHAAGKLHRDIKPSNVMVTPEGRVVLLDFGLVRDLISTRAGETGAHRIAGTAEYMSPEQAASDELSEASDWYSVGVMLYQAMTGKLPFSGPALRVLVAKQQFDPPTPSKLAPSVPADLEALCCALLRRAPAQRPQGHDVLAALGTGGEKPSAPPRAPTTLTQPFIGRGKQIEALSSCFDQLRQGRTLTAYVHGTSGMGKTALVRRFVESIPPRERAVILRGRCYERESVPYKAVDSLVDALSSHLRSLAPDEARALLPVDVAAAARIFPVLRRVEAIAEARGLRKETRDDQEVRRRGFAALREMFARIGIRRPLVLWIDDLQWGDVDSASLLGEILRPPDPPALLLIASYRSEEATESLPLRVLRDTKSQLGDRVGVVDIEVTPLAEDDAIALAISLLGRDDESARLDAEAIAREAGGSPFFVDALSRTLLATDTAEDARPPIRLDDFVLGRVAQLPEDARRLLEIAAVAARPVSRDVAVRAAAILPDAERTAMGVLRAAQLVRTVVVLGEEQIETYHDRIRESVVSHLSAEDTIDAHRRLARSLEASAHPDPEALVTHFRAANEPERAGVYAIGAATRAADALAFNRAADWYRLALELREPDAVEARALRSKLGDALSNAGRGAEAADVYFAAAEGAPEIEALDFKRLGASELLRGGHLDRGLAAVRDVLSTVGMGLPRTPRRALLSLLWRSLYLRARGLGYTPKEEGQIAPEVLKRVDICWSLTAGFGVVDNVRAREIQTRHLALALKSGERFRVARALASEIWPSSIAGPKAAAHVERIAKLAQEAAERSPNPHSLPFVTLCRGVSAYLMGHWRTSVELLDASAKELSDNHRGAAWEISNANIFSLWSLWNLGSVKELMRRVPLLLKEARERGDLLLETTARIGRLNVVWLAADDPTRAGHEVVDAMSRWSHDYVHQQHYYAGLAEARIALYTGNAGKGLELIEALWPRVAGAFLLKIQSLRAELTHLRAQLRVAVALDSADSERLLAAALRDATSLARERTPWVDGLGQLTEAAVANARGNQMLAVERLVSAERSFVGADMALWAVAARHRRGEILGGDDGSSLVDAAKRHFEGEQITRPDFMLDVFAPGFGRRARALSPPSLPRALPR